MTAEPATNRLKDGKFAKGNRANPGGRPRLPIDVRELARKHTKDAIETLIDVMLHEKHPSARVAAAQALLDRGYGKPHQSMTVDGIQQDIVKVTIGGKEIEADRPSGVPSETV